MNIGPYSLHPVDTGRFALDGGAMFGVVPKPLWEKESPADEKNRISLAARALLLQGGGRRILVDTGNGSKLSEKLRKIYRLDNSSSNLVDSLGQLGVSPADITDVVLTHLHFDHAGGATVNVRGKAEPLFPNAVHHVQREQWRAALEPTERDRASFFPDDFLPLENAGLLHLTDGEGELFPGLHLRVFHGHTAALQSPLISDGRTTLLYCADLVPLASHVQLPWIMAYDLRPLVTLEEKRGVFRDAASGRWLLFLEHDPRYVAVRVRAGEKGFEAGDLLEEREFGAEEAI